MGATVSLFFCTYNLINFGLYFFDYRLFFPCFFYERIRMYAPPTVSTQTWGARDAFRRSLLGWEGVFSFSIYILFDLLVCIFHHFFSRFYLMYIHPIHGERAAGSLLFLHGLPLSACSFVLRLACSSSMVATVSLFFCTYILTNLHTPTHTHPPTPPHTHTHTTIMNTGVVRRHFM